MSEPTPTTHTILDTEVPDDASALASGDEEARETEAKIALHDVLLDLHEARSETARRLRDLVDSYHDVLPGGSVIMLLGAADRLETPPPTYGSYGLG